MFVAIGTNKKHRAEYEKTAWDSIKHDYECGYIDFEETRRVQHLESLIGAPRSSDEAVPGVPRNVSPRSSDELNGSLFSEQLKPINMTDIDKDYFEKGSKGYRLPATKLLNKLAVLGLWPRCIETVYALSKVETYLFKAADFRRLFKDEPIWDEMCKSALAEYNFDLNGCPSDSKLYQKLKNDTEMIERRHIFRDSILQKQQGGVDSTGNKHGEAAL